SPGAHDPEEASPGAFETSSSCSSTVGTAAGGGRGLRDRGRRETIFLLPPELGPAPWSAIAVLRGERRRGAAQALARRRRGEVLGARTRDKNKKREKEQRGRNESIRERERGA